MATTNYSFTFWHANYTYTKWDVAQGASSTDSRFFYSTTDGNLNTSPLARFIYTPTNAAWDNNVVRVTFTQTGTTYFQPGSIVEVSNCSPNTASNYSGVVLAAGPGYVDYLCPGLSTADGIVAGQVVAPIHPYWTTGMWWIPSWSTQVKHNQIVVKSQLGEGYSQRQNPVINSNSQTWTLTFAERTDKETTSLLNFLEDKCGSVAFKMPFPVGKLYMNNNLKYVNGEPTHSLNSYGLNTVQVDVTQVFDL